LRGFLKMFLVGQLNLWVWMMILSWLSISWSTLPTGHVMQSFKLDRGIKSILRQVFSSVSSYVSEFNEFKPRLKSPNNRFNWPLLLNPRFWDTLISRTLGFLEDKGYNNLKINKKRRSIFYLHFNNSEVFCSGRFTISFLRLIILNTLKAYYSMVKYSIKK